jgi:2-iminobutanoate/2-iminopropanoate deaminase
MHIVNTHAAPQPGGHYSQAVVHGGIVYVAGQLPVDPADPQAPPGDVRSQTRQALANVRGILEAASSGMDRVLQMTLYVSDISHWGAVNEAYAEAMGDHRPARAIVPVGELHGGYVIEVQALATVKEGSPA